MVQVWGLLYVKFLNFLYFQKVIYTDIYMVVDIYNWGMAVRQAEGYNIIKYPYLEIASDLMKMREAK